MRKFWRTLFRIATLGISLLTAFGLLARFLPPDRWWPPAMIALVLPALLLLNFLVAVYFAWRKNWRWLAFPALIFFASIPLIPRVFAFGGDTVAKGKSIRLLTTNVHRFRNQDFGGIPDSLSTAFLVSAQPDILLLQEARDTRWKKNYFARIKRVSGLEKRHQLTEKTIATYANELNFVYEDFTTSNKANGFMVTDVATALGTVRVINVHLVSNEISQLAGRLGKEENAEGTLRRLGSMFKGYGRASAERAEQARSIRRWIEESPHPVVVGGDFNDVPSSYTYQYLLAPRLRDAWVEAGSGPGTTFTGPLPGLRIDYLMVDTSFVVRKVERIETGFSDHRGVRVELTKR